MIDEQLSSLYRIRFSEGELPRKNEIWKVICEGFLNRFIHPDSTVLDIACGYGEFINNIRGARKIAIDLNPDAKTFLNNEIEFHLCEAAAVGKLLQSQADTVFASNFLEHLPNKDALNALLSEIFKALKPGGTFLVLGPNLRYLPGEYWDFYDHHLGLTHLSLSEALKLHGFSVDLCIDKFLPYTTQGRLPTHPSLVRLYLKIPVAWKLLGKQFFIVATKPIG